MDLENLELVDGGDPILREKMPPFDFANPPVDPVELAKALVKKMVDEGGVGLSANQVGMPFRVFVIKAAPSFACFNPKIIDKSTEETDLEEGCLSYPGVVVRVKRPAIIKVRYTWPNGDVKTEKLSGLSAKIFEHELDHLDGKKFTDSLSRLQLERLLAKHYKSTGKKIPLAKFL